MAKLVYTALASLDGYIEDEDGEFDWAAPPDVRDDVRLGDRRHRPRRAGGNAGLVDECHLFLTPVIVGGGKRALPEGIPMDLELLDERRFESGTVFLRYGVSAGEAR